MESVLLCVSGVHRRFGPKRNRRTVLRGIDLELRRGEMVCVTGRSGAGKSTLLHLCAGLDRPDSGEVILDGHPVHRLSDRHRAHIRARTAGVVYQAFNLLEHLTVGENVMVPEVFLNRFGGDARHRAVDMLGLVGLADRFGCFPGVLSGGERQRVALARALFTDPPLLICDEVTANLDRETGADVVELIDSLRRDRNIGILASTHDEAMVDLCDRRVHLENGRFR